MSSIGKGGAVVESLFPIILLVYMVEHNSNA